MSAQNLKQRLLREVKRSPKKAAVLALLFMVATYSWAPLMIGLITNKNTGEAIQTTETAALLPANLQPITPPKSKAPSPSGTWKQLVQWIQLDWRSKPDKQAAFGRNPFAAIAAEEKEENEPVAEDPRPRETPGQLGLKLSGTVVGPRRRVAVINGRAYAQGRVIKVTEGVSFVVEKVDARQVTLVRGGESFVLKAVKWPSGQSEGISRVEP